MSTKYICICVGGRERMERRERGWRGERERERERERTTQNSLFISFTVTANILYYCQNDNEDETAIKPHFKPSCGSCEWEWKSFFLHFLCCFFIWFKKKNLFLFSLLTKMQWLGKIVIFNINCLFLMIECHFIKITNIFYIPITKLLFIHF